MSITWDASSSFSQTHQRSADRPRTGTKCPHVMAPGGAAAGPHSSAWKAEHTLPLTSGGFRVRSLRSGTRAKSAEPPVCLQPLK